VHYTRQFYSHTQAHASIGIRPSHLVLVYDTVSYNRPRQVKPTSIFIQPSEQYDKNLTDATKPEQFPHILKITNQVKRYRYTKLLHIISLFLLHLMSLH
jgi:hypothetical protein